MSLLSKITSPGRGKSASVGDTTYGSGSYLFGNTSLSGEVVSPASAAQIAAVFCGVKIIAETIGMISLDVYEKSNGTVHPLPKHPLQFRLHDEPNDDQTAIEWRMQMAASMALWGNAYSEKIMRGKRLAALNFIPPQTMNMRRIKGVTEYKYFPLNGSSTPRTFSRDEIFHPKTISLQGNGMEGTSPIAQVRNAFGLAMALERYGSRFFANDATPGGILIYPGEVDDEMNRNIRDSWKKLYSTADRSHEIAVIEEGVKYQQVGIDPEKAQALESRTFQVREISRVLRIPPHMLYETNQDSHNTIEQLSMEFVTYSLMPWIVIWEQALNRSLLTAEEKGRVFIAFNLEDLTKGDLASRYAAYSTGINNSWLTPNDVLRKEHMNPREDPGGDAYIRPMNMISSVESENSYLASPGSDTKPGGNAPSRTANPTPSTTPRSSKKAIELYECARNVSSNIKNLRDRIERELAA